VASWPRLALAIDVLVGAVIVSPWLGRRARRRCRGSALEVRGQVDRGPLAALVPVKNSIYFSCLNLARRVHR
jgi:hypothetical protein